MSVAFKGKSEEVEGDYWNLMDSGIRTPCGWRSQSSVCWIVVAAACLGFLLLTVILVGKNTSAINQWDTKYENLIYEITKSRDSLRDEGDHLKINLSGLRDERDHLKINLSGLRDERDHLSINLGGLRDERDRLKINLSNMTEEMALLQSRYNAVAASRDKLQEEVKRLSLNRTDKPCHVGWMKFNNKCYYASVAGVTKTWSNSRKDCQERGAELAIITTKDELDFVSRSYAVTWIGLSLQQDEWKWVDGTDFQHSQFWQVGEPNNSDGEEECAEVSRDAGAFNDVPCSRRFSWVCEEQ